MTCLAFRGKEKNGDPWIVSLINLRASKAARTITFGHEGATFSLNLRRAGKNEVGFKLTLHKLRGEKAQPQGKENL